MFMRMIYDEKLAQAAYLIGCQQAGQAVIIDPLRDVDRYIEIARDNGLRIVAAAETHIHADFLSGARELAEWIGARVYLSDEGDADWKYQWLDKRLDGGVYDHRLLRHGDTFSIGRIEFRVIHTPGHTPEHIVFLVTDRGAGVDEPIGMASGDFLFVGDLGRPDLLETAAGRAGAMEPSARRLFTALRALDEIPDFVQVWPGHGAGSACGKALGAVPTSTIGYERRFNPAIRAAVSEENFVDYILSGQPEPPLYFANMKRDNKLGPRVLGKLPIPPRMPAEHLREVVDRKALIVDTRPWDDFRVGHVPGALSIPLNRSFSTNAGSLVDERQEIHLIIAPQRLQEVVRDLLRIGLDRIVGWFEPGDVSCYTDASHALRTLEEVSPERALELVEAGSVRVLDVRTAAEFAEGHLRGAVNIAHTRLAARLDEVPRPGRVLVHCLGGARSARAAAYLQREGYEVINMHGGISACPRECIVK